ncbi:NUDIX hydrolase [Gulosibacter molinativorax]|uniref:NUDIX domain-containing protein n=1 Tax=Gulosibacter molinativorax TaxID=256821 RepID=A0ABT7C9F2_9MICO|nr:NUDIX hydrolase [Gulosibacter molinativorax]MDJ1371846.1 NUDIX domain-containing protein [Gulosibacter molinativorax]
MQSADRNGTRLAATAILMRDGESGLETLMMKRPAKGSFADAWVWPGGAVEEEDHGDALAPNEAEGAAALAAAVRETREETGLEADPSTFVAHAIWSPPAEVRPRFRTWFFMGPNPGGTPVAHESEVVDLAWVRPGDMLDAHAREEIVLAPPTWVTLFQISASSSTSEALERCAAEPFEHFETRVREGGKMFCWFGDAKFEDEDGTGKGRHRLEATTRPWRYVSEPGR